MDNINLSDSDMLELREAFFTQTEEMLGNLSGYIMAIEENPSEDTWKSLKRCFHTLKGDSRAMGFASIGTFAHKAEDLIAFLKDRELDKSDVDLLFECADAFEFFIRNLAEGGDPDPSEIITKIESCISSGAFQEKKDRRSLTAKSPFKGTTFLRIEPDRVDRIMDLVGELVIGRSMLSQLNIDLDSLQKEAISARLYHLSSSFERTLSELQHSVMKVRMLPVDLIFRRFPRVARDLSAEKGKLVKLLTQGETTELDKGIVDVIGEPLSHIIRNAIDHGIETPEERKEAGKQEEGIIILRAFHQGNQIVIEVEDDGRGLDTERLKEKALRKNFLSEDEAQKMTAQDAMDLIFLPGFSTSDSVSETSGRGVGMNIVKEVVESLKGIIEIESEKGRGTKFSLRLPLTLAIIKSILFSYKQEAYALPLTSVTEITRVFPKDLDSIAGKPVVRHRDRMVPLISIDGETSVDGKLFLIFMAVGQMRAALITEKIIGEEELVIKALDGKASTGIAAGASILGNGSVVVIVDPLSLIKKSSFQHDDSLCLPGKLK